MSTNKPSPFTGKSIRSVLTELALRIPAGQEHTTILIVGGAVMALNDLRESTEDIDSISHLPFELRLVIDDIAGILGLRDNWLNNKSRAFAPETIDYETCDILIETPMVRILSISLKQLFVMKVHAARERDIQDLFALWHHTGFTNSDEVMTAYRAAYPSAPKDEFLQQWLEEIIRRAQRVG